MFTRISGLQSLSSLPGLRVGTNLRSVRSPLTSQTPLTRVPTSIASSRSSRRSISTLVQHWGLISSVGTVAVSSGFLAFAAHRYKVSNADQYLIRTGLGIRDIKVSKQGFQWPFQTYKFIDMRPNNYSFDLQAMSSEKLEFILPGVFTVGPKDDSDSLIKYARFLVGGDANDKHIDSLIRGILEGEVRLESARMTVEEIFNDRKAFKEKLIKAVQEELNEFGLYIYNANIKELQDSQGSEYFAYIRQKKRSEAENRAKIDVSEAKKTGDIGQKEREAITRQQVATFESETVQRENERKQEMEKSNADLEVVKAEAFRRRETASIEANASTQLREAELQRNVEQKRIALETEKQRAVELSKAQVLAETRAKEAEGKAQATRLEAEASLYARQKEAEGIAAVLSAQASGVQRLIDSFQGNPQSLVQYLMLEKGLYPELAKLNAEAIRGLNPKITVWQTGESKDGYTKTIADVLKMVPPLMTTIHDQTGIKPPAWLMSSDSPTPSDSSNLTTPSNSSSPSVDITTPSRGDQDQEREAGRKEAVESLRHTMDQQSKNPLTTEERQKRWDQLPVELRQKINYLNWLAAHDLANPADAIERISSTGP
jgi:flotillin